MTSPRTENVVLVGPMGAGKSSVGLRLANLLGWRFVDLDDVVERRSGRSVSEIFEASGEAAFRIVEREAAAEVLVGSHVILATGGGWAAQPGSLESLRPGTLSVWLRVSAAETVRRTRASGVVRPLLSPAGRGSSPMDMVEAAASLAEARRDRYALADIQLETEATDIDRLAEIIAERIERKGLKF